VVGEPALDLSSPRFVCQDHLPIKWYQGCKKTGLKAGFDIECLAALPPPGDRE
jgi:hypothetical protein